jgi:D-alanine transaminase
MAKRIYFIDGKFRRNPLSTIEDRGFFFADSVYEVIRARNGKPFFLEEHLTRLEKGLKEIKIDLKLDSSYLEEVIKKSLKKLKKKEAAIYLQITRGKEPRSHLPRRKTKPTIIIITSEFRPLAPRLFKEGVSLILYPDIRWARCDIKTTMLLPNVLAKIEAKERGFFDALFYKNGYITESTSSSFFGIIGGKLLTHPATHDILPSITREKVLQIAKNLEIPVEERPLALEEIRKLEGAFLAGTTYDILPVKRIEEVEIPLSPLTSLIQIEYAKLLEKLSL